MKNILFVLLFSFCFSVFSDTYQYNVSSSHSISVLPKVNAPAGTYKVYVSGFDNGLFGVKDSDSTGWDGNFIMPAEGDDDGLMWYHEWTPYKTLTLPAGTSEYMLYDGAAGTSVTVTFVSLDNPSLSINLGNDITIDSGVELIVGATGQGGIPPYTYSWSCTRQPDSYPDSHTVKYNNPTAGEFDMTLTVTDNTGAIVSDTVHVTVVAQVAPEWKSNNIYNIPSSGTLNCTLMGFIASGTEPISFSIENGYSLPSGVSVNSLGVVYGTVSTSTEFTCRFVATNATGQAAGDVTFVFTGDAPQFTGNLPWSETLIKGGSGSINLSTVHSGSNLQFSASGLPSWCSLDGDILSFDVPNDLTSVNFTGIQITATNSFGECTTELGFTIQTIGAAFYFLSGSTCQGVGGQNMQYQTTTNLGASYSLGAAPSFLSMDSNGLVQGIIPEGVTTFQFEVIAQSVEHGTISQTVKCVVTDSQGNSDSQQHVIVDNFEDFGATLFAHDVRTYLNGLYANTKSLNDQFGAFSSSVGGKLDTMNQNLLGVNQGVDSINNNITGIKSSLDSIKDSLNQQPTSGASLSTPVLPDVSTLGRDWESVVSQNDIDVSSYNVKQKVSSIFPSTTATAPVLVVPLSTMNTYLGSDSFQDIPIDFSEPSLNSTRTVIRVILVAFVYLVIIYGSVRIISSMEF